MKLAVMQPYFMPYIGYWQLLGAVDKFVVLDDVAFIPKGWVNRNRILVNGAAHLFTLPVRQASQNRRINELELAVDESWLKRFRNTVTQSYRQAPYFAETWVLVDALLTNCRGPLLYCLLEAIRAVARHLEIGTKVALASHIDPEHGRRGQGRILELCRREYATDYFNLPGGKQLYDREAFRHEGVRLGFIEPEEIPYPQLAAGWTPWLSIIDVMMHMGRDGTRGLLGRHQIS